RYRQSAYTWSKSQNHPLPVAWFSSPGKGTDLFFNRGGAGHNSYAICSQEIPAASSSPWTDSAFKFIQTRRRTRSTSSKSTVQCMTVSNGSKTVDTCFTCSGVARSVLNINTSVFIDLDYVYDHLELLPLRVADATRRRVRALADGRSAHAGHRAESAFRPCVVR